MRQSLFDPFNFFKNFIDFGLRLLLFFWIVFGFRNTRLAFWYFQQLAGSISGDYVEQITKLNKEKTESLQFNQTKINAIETFLEFSTIALMNAKSIKDGQFEIGYYSMINEEKLVSVNSYVKRLKTCLKNGYLNWRISSEEVEGILKVLDTYSKYHKPVSASILFVIQTECLKSIGCPIYDWYAKEYFIALHYYLADISKTEKGECLQKAELVYLIEKLESLSFSPIDEIAKIRVLLEDKDNCSLGKVLPYIKGDQIS
jgi:hypothetical protein